MTDTITLPRSVVEQALEAWEQARGALAYVAVGNAPSNPNLARSTCSQAVWVLDNAEPALRAALEQRQVEQEPVAWIRGLPEEATHIAAAKAKVRSGGQIDISIRAFKYDDGVLMVYVTDNDNEYPGWRKAADAFYHLNFPVIPISTHPQPPRQPLTDEQILKLGWAVTPYANQIEMLSIARAIERAHGIGGEE